MNKRIKDLIDGVYSEKSAKDDLKRAQAAVAVEALSEKDLGKRIKQLEKQMLEHARNLEFEQAARGSNQPVDCGPGRRLQCARRPPGAASRSRSPLHRGVQGAGSRLPHLPDSGGDRHADGTLLAFAEARRTGAADSGDIDLVLKRSRDGGATWSPLQVVGDNGPNTFGNPCPVLDAADGVMWLLAVQNLATDCEKDIIAGTSKGSQTVWVLKSTDEGTTWSAPVEITASVKPAGWTWYATGPGVGIQTRDGRLVIPANQRGSGHWRLPLPYVLQRRRRA